MDVEELVAVLERAGLDVDPVEAAEAWWLAELSGDARAAVFRAEDPGAADGADSEEPTRRPPSPDERRRADELVGRGFEYRAPHTPAEAREPVPDLAGLLAREAPPRVPALDRRRVVRALRPLRQRVERGPATVLDEAATADATARAGVLVPVFRPRSERRLSARIVVDRSESMTLWAPEAAAFESAVMAAGVFRHLTTVGFVPAPGARFPSDRDPDAVHLVLTDGIADYWAGAGDALSGLRRAAIVQPLPERLWDRTTLVPRPGVLRSVAGTPRLSFQPRGRGGSQQPDLAGVPVLDLAGLRMAAWAPLLAGSGRSTRGSAYLSPTADDQAEAGEIAGAETDPADIYARFAAGASPPARQLAVWLAVSGAVVTVPTALRLLSALTSKGSIEHVIEVLYGGLVERRAEPDRFGDVVFEYPEGLRSYLSGFGPARVGQSILQTALAIVARKLGANEPTRMTLPIEESQQFAESQRALRWRLGSVAEVRGDEAEAFGALADRQSDPAVASGLRWLAAAAAIDGPPREAARRADLAVGLDALRHFHEHADPADLDRAVESLRRAGRRLDLAEALITRARLSGEGLKRFADFREAADLYKEITSAGPVEQPERVVPRAVRAGLAAGTAGRRDWALGLARDALRDVPERDPGFPERAELLGEALRRRYDVTGSPGHLDESVVVLRQAVDAAVDDADRFRCLMDRASALEARSERFGGAVPDLAAAAECYQQAVKIEPGSTSDRAAALAGLARTLLRCGRRPKGQRVAGEALSLFEQLGEYRHPVAARLRQLLAEASASASASASISGSGLGRHPEAPGPQRLVAALPSGLGR